MRRILPQDKLFRLNSTIKEQVFIKYKNGKHGVVDLIVYMFNIPILVIETKTKLLKRSKKQINQAKRYSKALDVDFFTITNGFEFSWYNLENDELEKISNKKKIPAMLLENICFLQSQIC